MMKRMLSYKSQQRMVICVALFFLYSPFFMSRMAAQAVLDIIKEHPAFASCNYNVYPDSVSENLTPAPMGKHPFYISHYGRHGSRYISNRTGYDTPYKMMQRAEVVHELTTTGRKVLDEMELIMADAESRWGDLTSLGRKQHLGIAQRMFQRFPEVFADSAHICAISTVVPRCMASMTTAMIALARLNPKLNITMESSKRNQWYMNYQDPLLRKNFMTPKAEEAYNAYTASRMGNSRLMELVFKNPDIVKEIVDEEYYNYYLMKMGLFPLNTHLNENTYLMNIFSTEELYRMWEIDNVYWYIRLGACKLNGGNQPYTQRHLLRQIIADADSCIRLGRPGAHLRFGHDTVLLPLVCLIGVNGYDLETDDFDELEKRGWWSSSVFPMGANLQFIFYRSDPSDQDVLFKVLLNEEEAKLPLRPVSGPYYRWADFRRYCLKKIDRYERSLQKKQ